MMKLAIAAAALLAVAGQSAPHGGRIKWVEPKSAADFENIIQQSHLAGRAVMVYYTQDN